MTEATSDSYLPNYLVSADNHNLANGGVSWLDPQSWGTKLGNVGKFIAGSALSGTNSFYNTAVAVGNWFGAETPERDTASWITEFDTDLGKYYRENQAAVDLGGFVLGSLVPGIGGVKIFNAGQVALKTALAEGKVGGTLAKSLGLLVDRTDNLLSAAAAEINGSTTALKLLNVNTTKALAAGVWQNTLEAAAFETIVQATMFRSPILDQQDAGDIAQNIAVGGLLGGTIGGAFGAAKLLGTLKKSVAAEDVLRRPFMERPAMSERTTPSERIVQLAHDTEVAATQSVQGPNQISSGVSSTLLADRIRKNFDDTRTAIHDLTGQDTVLANVVANLSQPLVRDGQMIPGFAQNYFANFSGAIKILRPMEESAAETRMLKAIAKGEVPEQTVAPRFVKLFGDDAGKVSESAPLLPSLGDLHSGEKAVLSAVRKYEFAPKFDGSAPWSVLTVSGNRGYLEAEARYIWASKVLKEIPEGAIIGKYDIPVLERAYKDFKPGIKIISGEGPSLEVLTVSSKQELYDILKASKEDAANYLLYNMSIKKGGHIPVEQGTEAAARIVNTRQGYLEGLPSSSEADDLFAAQTNHTKYLEELRARGLSTNATEVVDPVFLPKYAKIIYDVDRDIAATTPNILDAITFYKTQQKIYEEGASRVFARVIGEPSQQFPDITDRMLLTANRSGSGAGLISAENANYGTLGSTLASVGSVTRNVKQLFRKQTSDAMAAPLVKLGGKQEAAFEFESINQKVTRSGQLWVRLSDGGEEYLVTQRAAKQFTDKETGAFDYDSLFASLPEDLISLKHAETVGAIDAHIQASGRRTQAFRDIRSQQGHTDAKDPSVFRPIRPDLKQYPHFAFVVDPRVTGSGHKTMIHAASEKELAALIDKVPAQYKVVTKSDTEEFFRARGEYEYSRTLNENYINSDLSNAGVFSNFFPKSDPQKIIDDVIQQHFRESDTLVTEAVRLRYEAQFSLLEDFGKQYSKIETSRFAARSDILERTSNNPYFNYIKTALDISKINEHPLIYGFNKLLDTATSKAVGAYRDAFAKAKSPAELETINAQMDVYGMKPAFYDASLQALANHTAPRGELTKFVRSGNSLLSLFTLGLDPLNALNNAIGSNILRMTELRHLTKAIEAGDSGIAGELAAIAKVATPGAPGEILAPTKLVAKAISNFWADQGPLMARYKSMGLIKDRAEQLKMLADDFTLTGTETVSELQKRTSQAFTRAKDLAETGEKVSGNKLAEEFNRFISANVIDQLTSIATRRGLMDDATAQTYINTFVNRVEGNIVASQRPLIFQGPVGQAISLFQSYQFNLLQQLFRYVGEGKSKDLAMLAGLQSTLYGIQSLPAFQFMNVHIIGQASGNKEHRDAYDAVYGTVGRTAGNWVLYGMPSNILQTNIYSRGDINPRHLTILPTTLQEIPVVQGWGKFLGSMYDTSKKITGGAPFWESVLQGVEHNGVSRPLAGFAQTLQSLGPEGKVYSTSSKGTILYENDLVSFATLTRLAGGRPLDEAVVNDAMFRVKSYEAARRKDMSSLAEKVKMTLIQGNQPDAGQVQGFAASYAELGGKQKGFNKWMMDLYRSANTSQAEQLQGSLNNPFSYKVQLLMGGDE